ncbi:hypothetical protein LXA43DRAFT_345042 [Ganoderma leucocontextum]|nr:hypothetical protein LXA43DRAFT_345042 [Ganoderma leucocontextum]
MRLSGRTLWLRYLRDGGVVGNWKEHPSFDTRLYTTFSELPLTSVTGMCSNSSPHDGVNVQEFAPVNHGIQAWTLWASGFVLETLIWGFSYWLGVGL